MKGTKPIPNSSHTASSPLCSGSRVHSEYSLSIHRRDRLGRVSPPDGLSSRLGQGEVLHFAPLDEFLDGSRNILNRHGWIDAMLVEKIDHVNLQSLQRGVRHLPDVIGPAVDTIAGAVRIDAKPKLGGNHYLIAARRERFSDQYFVGERTIRLSSVKQCDAALDSGANDFDASSRSIGGP